MYKESIDGDHIFIIHEFFTPEECDAFVARSEQEGYEDATINTFAGVAMNKAIRDNARLMFDDPALADTLWHRLRDFLPPTIEEWRVLGLNERFRCYRVYSISARDRNSRSIRPGADPASLQP